MARSDRTLTDADNGKTVSLRVGDGLVLHLYENATTGYRWVFEDPGEKLVTVHDDGYVRQPKAVGGGGLMQWTLHAKAAGKTQIKLKRLRRWEGESSAREGFAVSLIIRPSKVAGR